MSDDDRFEGAWLVAEYVHDPDGTFVGIVHQRRRIEPSTNGRLRVTQVCEPDARLADHPMGAFAGEWVFELEVDGRHRHYLGPDVVGLGTEWSPGAMTGSGLWPRFGHEFTSYGVLVAPDRQLTGGFFSVAGRPVADIIGVAIPEALGVMPELDLEAQSPTCDIAGTIARTIGPACVAVERASPTEERRCFAMTDSIGGVTLTIEQTTTFGDRQGTSASVTVR